MTFPSEPAAPAALRESVRSQMDTFGLRHGDQLGKILWSRQIEEMAVMTASLIEAEVIIWVVTENRFVPLYQGPRTSKLPEGFGLRVGSGPLSMVYATGQTLSDTESAGSLPELESCLGILLQGLVAAPLFFGPGLQGVVSAMRFTSIPDAGEPLPSPFGQRDILRFESLVATISKLFDHQWFSQALGLT